MYNFWFAVEDSASLLSLRKGITRSEINATWFPVSRLDSPFTNLVSALSKAAARGTVDALFYESARQPFPAASLMRRIPTLVSLDNVQAVSKLPGGVLPAGFTVWSEWARAELIKQFKVAPNRVQVVRSGVDLANWDEALANFERARGDKAGLPPRVRLLFSGDDFAGLGGELLLDLFRHNPLLAQSCELHLVVTRNTAATYLHPALRPRNVHVHTLAQTRQAPTELFLNADIFVLPSLKPASPSLVAKALAACLPVVATKVGGLPELVHHEQNGLLVEPGDGPALVQALMGLIENPARRYTLGEESRRIAEAEFGAARNNHQIVTFLKQLAAEAPAAVPAHNFGSFAAALQPEAYPSPAE